ncbi:MAG: hypothetical protein AB7O67_13320 [Vicinamibacterales bacterium]
MSLLAVVDPHVVNRVRAEFIEMPGLRLTPTQAQRLWGLDRHTCEAVVAQLTATRELVRGADGRISAVSVRP